MKKLFTIAAIAAASTALAVESSNTFGILRVDSSAAQTIVSVPWEGAGASGESANKIKVKDVVKTANLTEGDQLYYYDTTSETPSYKLWVLQANGTWAGATSVKGEGGATVTASAGSDDLITRGGAIILVRPTNHTQSFYLYGQYTNAASSTTCVAGGYTLLAPPSTEDTDLNTKTWSNVGASDYIILGNGKMLTYKNSTWGYDTRTRDPITHQILETHDTDSAVIPAGEGAWYKSNSSQVASVVWVAVQQ